MNVGEMINQLNNYEPSARLVVIVDSDIVGEEGYSFYQGFPVDIRPDRVVTIGDRIWVESEDREELEEKVYDDLCDITGAPYLGVEDEAESQVADMRWEPVVVLQVNELPKEEYERRMAQW